MAALGNRARGQLLNASEAQPRAGLAYRELGRQPDPYARAVLQSALGRDLGDVRVRSGPDAVAALDALGADAMAAGRNVSIRPDHDRPGTLGGRALLLHELVHVLQQADRAGGTQVAPGAPESAVEQEEQARRLAVELVARPPLPLRRMGEDTHESG